jgi:hypothetical protein
VGAGEHTYSSGCAEGGHQVTSLVPVSGHAGHAFPLKLEGCACESKEEGEHEQLNVGVGVGGEAKWLQEGRRTMAS